MRFWFHRPGEEKRVKSATDADSGTIRAWLRLQTADDLAPAILRGLVEGMGATSACLCMRDTDTGRLAIQGHIGVSDSLLRDIAGHLKDCGDDEVLVPDCQEWLVANCEAAGLLFLPLAVEGCLKGILLYSKSVDSSRRDEIANTATVAVANTLALESSLSDMRSLSLLGTLSRHIASHTELPSLINEVVNRLPLLVSAEAAGVMLYDAGLDGLVLQKPAFGLADEALIAEYRQPLTNMSAACRVFMERKPFISNSPAADPGIIQRYVELYKPRTLVAVPLVLGGKAIGVLNVHNKEDGRHFTLRDVEIVQLLADYTAVLIGNALLLDNAKKRAQELETLNNANRKHSDELQTIIEMQAELTELSLTGAGMDGVARWAARKLARDVLVLDNYGELICSTNQDATTRLRVSVIPGRGDLPRPTSFRSTPDVEVREIASKEHVLGFVLISRGDTPMTQLQELALEQTRVALALELMKQRAVLEQTQRLRGSFINELLAGNTPTAELIARSLRLGHDITLPHWVMVIEARRDTEPLAFPMRAAALEQIEKRARYGGTNALIAPKGKGIIVLLQATGHQAGSARTWASAVCQTVERILRVKCVAGMSQLCTEVNGFQLAWRQAAAAARMAAHLPPPQRVQAYEELGVYRILADSAQSGVVAAFSRDVLGRLIEHEQNRQPVLLNTLSTFLHSEGNLKNTAAHLHIHVNTLRYRLSRIEEVMAISLKDHSKRLELELALAALAIGKF